jgi:hypothetical protein
VGWEVKLTDLEPEFLKRTSDNSSMRVDSILDADGVFFLCPVCFKANGGNIGTHACICWRPRVPLNIDPKPGRWEFEGTRLNDLTLVAGSSSILLTSGCKAHFFIRNGEIVFT